MENKPIPKFPISMPGTFWAITAFFNPAGYKNKYNNYRLFRENSKRQGLKLIVIELAFFDRPFELKKENAEILIQIRGGEKNMLWQKERLLNIGLKHLPPDCDKVCWVDCDIIFSNDNWIKETSTLLEQYIVVQPFSVVIRLPSNVYNISNDEIAKLPYGRAEKQKLNSFAFSFLVGEEGHEGFSCAFRRDEINKLGFYDYFILGGADTFMMASFVRKRTPYLPYGAYANKWAELAGCYVQKSIYFTEGTIMHFWHGDFVNKHHWLRSKLLDYFKFDPARDLKIDENGIWEWLPKDRKITKAAKEIFLARQEEGEKKSFVSFLLYELKRTKQELSAIKSTRNPL